MPNLDGALSELNELLWTLPVSLDANAIVAAVLERGSKAFRSPLGGLWRTGPEGSTLVGVYGLTDKKAEQLWAGLPLEEAPPDTLNLYGDKLATVGAFGKRRLGALVAIPLKVPGLHLGWLVFARLDPEPYTAFEEQLLGIIANRVAGAMDNARLYAEAERRSTELALLSDVTGLLVSPLQVQDLLNAVVLRIVETFKLTLCSIQLLDPSSGTLPAVAVYHRDPATRVKVGSWLESHPLRHDAGLTSVVFASRKPYLSPDFSGEAAASQGLRDVLGTGSLFVLPLLVRGRMMGAMYWFKGGRQNPLTENMLPLASQLSGQIAMAIENTQLHGLLAERAGEPRPPGGARM